MVKRNSGNRHEDHEAEENLCREGRSPLFILTAAAGLTLMLLAVVAWEVWRCCVDHASLQTVAEGHLAVEMIRAHRERMLTTLALVGAAVLALLGICSIVWLQIRTYLRQHSSSQQALSRSRQRYRELFMRTLCALWEEDCSALIEWFETLRRQGVKDLKSWLIDHPEELRGASELIRLVDVNDAAVAMFEGADKQELIANKAAIYTDRTVESLAAMLDAIWRGQPSVTLETVAVTLKNRPIRFVAQCSLSSDHDSPDSSRIIVAMTDITDRARTQQALRFRLDLEERVTRISTELINLEPEEIDPAINRALADISDLARADRSYVFLYSPDGRTMSNTHEYCRSGIPPVQQTLQAVPISTFPWFQAMIQQHDAILIDRVDDLEPEAAAEKQEFQREGIQSLLCVPMICKDRIMGFVGFDRVRECNPWAPETITLLKIVGTVFANALDRKEAEQERQRLMKTLDVKNDELQSIVYVASHDLKSPLVNIQGFSGELARTCEELTRALSKGGVSDQIRREIDSLLREDIPESLRFIKAGTAKMQSLLNGLLAVSRVGSAVLHVRRLDMNEMMRQIIAAMQYQISESNAEVIVEDLPDCLGDCDYINQVFSNLLSNAVKYLQPGRPGRIRVSGRVDPGVRGQAVYCVEDNGLGISPSHQRKVFEIFHRLEPEKTAGGEGLGLTIALRIVERHGGRIWIESEPHKGSRFFVSLPAPVDQPVFGAPT